MWRFSRFLFSWLMAALKAIIFILALYIIGLILGGVLEARAEELLNVGIETNGSVTYLGQPDDGEYPFGSGAGYCFTNAVYKGIYPDISEPITTGGLDCTHYNDSWADIIPSIGTTAINATSTDGQYWFEIDYLNNSPLIEWYVPFYINNGLWFSGLSTGSDSSFILDQSYEPEYIQIIKPIYGTTTATTSIYTEIFYSTPLSLDFRPTTTKTYIISDAVNGAIEYVYKATTTAGSAETITINENLTLATGSKKIEAFYADLNGIPYSEIDTSYFHVVNNTYFEATGLLNPNDSSGILTQNDCVLYDIGCQFQRAILFTFYPSENALERFSNIWQTLSYLKPFGYLTVSIEQLESIDSNATAKFSLGEIPFQETIFDPFRDSLSSILWAVFAIYFFLFRLRNINI